MGLVLMGKDKPVSKKDIEGICKSMEKESKIQKKQACIYAQKQQTRVCGSGMTG